MESIDVGCAQLLSPSNRKLDFGLRPCGLISSYITDTGARDEMDDCSKYVLGKDSCKYQQRSRQLQSSFCLYKFVLENWRMQLVPRCEILTLTLHGLREGKGRSAADKRFQGQCVITRFVRTHAWAESATNCRQDGVSRDLLWGFVSIRKFC